MGRPQGFDREEALRGAMGAFRRKGFEATSMKDLEAATGLLPGSLYHGFGSKEGLFLEALAHYNERVVKGRIATYLRGADPRKELRALFLSTLEERGDRALGCLLTNTAVEFGGASEAVKARLEEGFALLEKAFAAQCRRALELGQAAPGLKPRRAALRLLQAYQGLLVLVRAGRREGLRALVDESLAPFFTGAPHG